MYEDRIQRAVDNFRRGYNCSQAVVAAFADLYGLDESMALKISSSFGGGIGKMRQTCGAACGAFMLAGLETGTTDPSDVKAKNDTYATVQQLASRFKQENGSLICGELLGLVKPADPAVILQKKRPCVKMVEAAAQIFADYLSAKNGAKGNGETQR